MSAFFSLALAAPFAAALSPQAGDEVAVFAFPLRDARAAAESVAASGGRLLGARAGAIIAHSDAPDFVRDLYAAGAVLVVRSMRGTCDPSPGRDI